MLDRVYNLDLESVLNIKNYGKRVRLQRKIGENIFVKRTVKIFKVNEHKTKEMCRKMIPKTRRMNSFNVCYVLPVQAT